MTELKPNVDELNVVKIGMNPQAYGSGFIYTADGDKIPFKYDTYDGLQKITSHPSLVQTFFFDDEKMMLETPKPQDCEFEVRDWTKKRSNYGVRACAVMGGKIEDGKLYYRFCDCNEWKIITKRDDYSNDFPSWLGGHKEMRFSMRNQYDEWLTTIANKLPIFYNPLNYGNDYEIRYKD